MTPEPRPSLSHLVPLLRQFTSYFGVMLIALAADYGTYVVQVAGLGIAAVHAAVVSAVVGAVVAYIVNRRHVFASERSHAAAGGRFAVVSLVGIGLTWLFMTLFVDHLTLNYMLARIMTSGITVVWSFLANKFWSFG